LYCSVGRAAKPEYAEPPAARARKSKGKPQCKNGVSRSDKIEGGEARTCRAACFKAEESKDGSGCLAVWSEATKKNDLPAGPRQEGQITSMDTTKQQA